MPDLTPSQTIGPFFHGGAQWLKDANQSSTSWIPIEGSVLDADGKGVSDAMLECSFPADSSGFQRVFTDDNGGFRLHVPAGGCAHITLFARGLLKHVFTRLYLSEQDVPASVPAARRTTLVARREGDCHRWDIRLRGEGETVFFEID